MKDSIRVQRGEKRKFNNIYLAQAIPVASSTASLTHKSSFPIRRISVNQLAELVAIAWS